MKNPMKPTSRSTRHRWLPVAVVSLLVVLVGATVWRTATGDEEEAGAPTSEEGEILAEAAVAFSAEAAVPVTVDTVQRGTLRLEVSATGQTEAARRAKVVSRVAGRIVRLPVDESATVAAGRLLVALDPREYALAVETAEAELEEARARYREMTLFDERLEDIAVREERARAARARSGLDRAEIALRKARLDLSNSAVSAPFAGRVADVNVTTGEYVTQGHELMTVVALNPIRVEVAVPESEIRHLREGAGATVRLPAFPGVDHRGRIASINPVVDPESRTGRVTVELSNPDGEILPGMYARVVLEGRALEDRVMVPREAIVERDDRFLVFVFESVEEGAETGLAKWVYVTPGLGNARMVEVVESDETGVPEAGSLVITGGHYTLVHDAPVRIAVEEGS